MAVIKSCVVVSIGLLMLAVYLIALAVASKLTGLISPSFGVLLFLTYAVLSALAFMRLQTILERWLIKRHVMHNPNSSWRYIRVK